MGVSTTVSFGTAVAIFLPGVVLVYAVRYVLPAVDTLLSNIEGGTAVLGPAILLILGATLAGNLLSDARYMTLDLLFKGLNGAAPRIHYSKLKTEENQRVFETIVEGHYRRYQFSGNAFIAVLLFVLLRFVGASSQVFSRNEVIFLVIVASILVALFFSAKVQQAAFAEAIREFEQSTT